MQKRCASAEERVQELEQYIKASCPPVDLLQVAFVWQMSVVLQMHGESLCVSLDGGYIHKL